MSATTQIPPTPKRHDHLLGRLTSSCRIAEGAQCSHLRRRRRIRGWCGSGERSAFRAVSTSEYEKPIRHPVMANLFEAPSMSTCRPTDASGSSRMLVCGGPIVTEIDLAVDLVGQNAYVPIPGPLRYGLQLAVGIDRSRGITGGAQNEPFRPVGIRRVEIVRRQEEVPIGTPRYRDGVRPGEGHDLGVARPVWRRHENLVARSEEGEGRVEQGLLRS